MVGITERFGAWVLNTRVGLIFGLILLVLSGAVTFRAVFGSAVMLDAKHFECTMSRPDGLGSMCVEYRYRGK